MLLLNSQQSINGIVGCKSQLFEKKGKNMNEECINCIYFNPVNKSCIVKNNTDHDRDCDDFDNHPYEE